MKGVAYGRKGKGVPIHSIAEGSGMPLEDVKLFFEDAPEMNFDGIPYESDKTVEKDHGRTETREYRIGSDIDWLFGKEKWDGIKSMGMVRSERDTEGKVSTETRYYISSIEADAGQFRKAVRGHRET